MLYNRNSNTWCIMVYEIELNTGMYITFLHKYGNDMIDNINCYILPNLQFKPQNVNIIQQFR